MTTREPVRLGIVGCGEVAQLFHIPILLKIKNLEVAAACDSNEELAKRAAERLHISRYYADFPRMLEREKLDAVGICTPPNIHAALSIQAMEAGCHVLVEKPMAVSTQEADEMIRVAEDCGVKLGVIHNMLFVPVAVKARTMVGEGSIGDLTGIDMKYSLYKHESEIINREHWCHKLPGGLFGHKLPHPIYLAMAFLGNLEPVAVHTAKFSGYEWMIPDELRVILKGEKGLGTITMSANWPKDMALLDIFGTRMNLYVHFNSAAMITYGPGEYGRFSRGLENVRQGFQLLAGTASAALKIALARHHYGHYVLIRQFIESVRNGTEPLVKAEEGREVVRVCEKIITQMGGDLQKVK